MTAEEIAREYFPDASKRELEHVIWGRTGFPSFWPEGYATAEEAFRAQLAEHRDALAAGMTDCPDCSGGWKPLEAPCGRCGGTSYVKREEVQT